MFVANHMIVDWGPHGMWLSNCSDDVNSLRVIMLLKWHRRLLILQWSITMTEDFLGGLTVERTPLVLESSLINRLGLNNGTSGNLLQALRNLGLGLDISQGPVVAMAIISFAMINHILYKPVFHFLLL